jgi:hypothetical protein
VSADPNVLYTRALPGGGFVAVEAEREDDSDGTHRGWVSVERRADPLRRSGHQPPVIAEATAPSYASVLQELYGIAADNVSIAKGLLRWQAHRRTG